jgi:hypothetical protein
MVADKVWKAHQPRAAIEKLVTYTRLLFYTALGAGVDVSTKLFDTRDQFARHSSTFPNSGECSVLQ